MPKQPGDSPSSTSATGVDLGGAALAAGAVLAGLTLRGKGSLSLAAGLAAAAGVRLLTRARPHPAGPLPEVETPHSVDPDPEPAAPLDWVDSAAILPEVSGGAGHATSGMVPVPSGALQGFGEFPLLDDLGEPVEPSAAVLAPPARKGEPSEYAALLGPLIWEPDQEVVSCSDASGETVWFGLQDVSHVPVDLAAPVHPTTALPQYSSSEVVPASAPDMQVEVVLPQTPPPIPPSAGIPEATLSAFTPFVEAEEPVLPAPAVQMGPDPGTAVHSSETADSILDSLRTEAQAETSAPPPAAPPPPVFPTASPFAIAHGEPPAPPSGHPSAPAPSVPAPSAPSGGEALSFADWMLASQSSAAPASPAVFSPLPPTSLPAPRVGGALPRSTGGGVAPARVSLHAELSAGELGSALKRRRSKQTSETGVHRSMSPMAPTRTEGPKRVRLVLVFTLAALLAGLAVGTAVWKSRSANSKSGEPGSGSVWTPPQKDLGEDAHADASTGSLADKGTLPSL